MIEISAQPKLKVSGFHLGIAFIQNQSPMKTGVTMNQKAKIRFEKVKCINFGSSASRNRLKFTDPAMGERICNSWAWSVGQSWRSLRFDTLHCQLASSSKSFELKDSCCPGVNEKLFVSLFQIIQFQTPYFKGYWQIGLFWLSRTYIFRIPQIRV